MDEGESARTLCTLEAVILIGRSERGAEESERGRSIVGVVFELAFS